MMFLGFWALQIFATKLGFNQGAQVHSFQTLSIPYAVLNGFFLALTWTNLNRTLEVSSASHMTMMSMITPVFVSILAMIFLGETVVGVQIAGIETIIMSGVVTYFSGIARD